VPYDILITNAVVLPLADATTDTIAPGYVAIQGDSIAALGSMTELPADTKAHATIDGSGMLAMPGLINTHNHAAMTLFRGLADDLQLMEWLTKHIFPAEARFVNPEMVYWCSKLAAAEMIRSGTTCVADGYFHEDAAAEAFCDAGLRAVAAQGLIDFPAPGVPDPADNVAAAGRFLDRWQGRHPLLTPALFCHSPYTCGPTTITAGKALARERGVPFFIHLAESRDEIRQITTPHGETPTRHLHKLGILDPATVCVHCVWLDETDQQLLATSGAGVAACPGSNMKLASGIAPLAGLVRRGVAVGLGTDGCASNNNLDLFAEMDLAAKLQKVHALDPTVLPARRLLAMATGDGARVLGMADRIGSLTPGKKADCILIDLRQPGLSPCYSPDLLVYAAGGRDVRTVIINGRVVLRDRELLAFDQQEAMDRVNRLALKVRAPT